MTTSSGSARRYAPERFYLVALDPVHVGAGGYRLGRVDLSIVREPGTNLPKIPGTSLAGAARSYAAMRYGKPEAAGRHSKFVGKRDQCPIIYTFGTATGVSGGWSGTVSMGDARVLLFPVASQSGPLWVSTLEILREAWGQTAVDLPKQGGKEIEPDDSRVVTSLMISGRPSSQSPRQPVAEQPSQPSLSLGWLLLPSTTGLQIKPPVGLINEPEWKAIASRIVLATPKIFAQVVNSNLEVRTSVSIDPETGAAETGALFTYEAIPRATWLWCDVVVDDYRGVFEAVDRQYKAASSRANGAPVASTANANSDNSVGTTNARGGNAVGAEGQLTPATSPDENVERGGDLLGNGEIWNSPLDVVKAGMRVMEYLGVGGMGTRGFGRLRWVESQPKPQHNGAQS